MNNKKRIIILWLILFSFCFFGSCAQAYKESIILYDTTNKLQFASIDEEIHAFNEQGTEPEVSHIKLPEDISDFSFSRIHRGKVIILRTKYSRLPEFSSKFPKAYAAPLSLFTATDDIVISIRDKCLNERGEFVLLPESAFGLYFQYYNKGLTAKPLQDIDSVIRAARYRWLYYGEKELIRPGILFNQDYIFPSLFFLADIMGKDLSAFSCEETISTPEFLLWMHRLNDMAFVYPATRNGEAMEEYRITFYNKEATSIIDRSDMYETYRDALGTLLGVAALPVEKGKWGELGVFDFTLYKVYSSGREEDDAVLQAAQKLLERLVAKERLSHLCRKTDSFPLRISFLETDEFNSTEYERICTSLLMEYKEILSYDTIMRWEKFMGDDLRDFYDERLSFYSLIDSMKTKSNY